MFSSPRHALAEMKRRRALMDGVPTAKSEVRNVSLNIKRVDADRQLVFAEVYTPYVLDTYGEYMTPQDIEVMAHRFMELDLSQVIDTNHDNVPNGSRPVESFIARKGDPDFTEGSWVMGVHVAQPDVWDKVLRGDLNGFSFEAMVIPRDDTVEVAIIRDHVGRTKTDKGPDHEHEFFVQVNQFGRVVRGMTSKAADGHFHVIGSASVTMKAGTDNHVHRFDLF